MGKGPRCASVPDRGLVHAAWILHSVSTGYMDSIREAMEVSTEGIFARLQQATVTSTLFIWTQAWKKHLKDMGTLFHIIPADWEWRLRGYWTIEGKCTRPGLGRQGYPGLNKLTVFQALVWHRYQDRWSFSRCRRESADYRAMSV